MSRWRLVLVLVAIAGCATSNALHEGRSLIEQGRMEEGIRRLEEGVKANPDDVELRTYYTRNRDVYVNQLLYEGDKMRMLGRSDEALAAFQRALQLNPESARAKAGVEAIRADQRQRADVAEAQKLFDAGKGAEALEKLNAVLAENPAQKEARALLRRIEESQLKAATPSPQLRAEYRKPVTVEFRDAPLKSVFEVLSRASGINFVFDRDIRPDLRTTIYLRDTSIEDAVNFLLVTNQLEKKILNDNTILVYPNLPNKAREYEELMVKSFYLANADVKQTMNLIKTVVKTRDVFIDERLNLLVMRDTPEAIRLAEKLIAAQDLAEPEVLLEVEVLEVQRSKLQELGIRYPAQASVGLEGAGGPGEATLEELQGSVPPLVRINVTDPALVINLRRQDGNTNILANPRIRVKNREKAKIHIGDRLPVITTTSTANVGVSESVQYLDVGLKLDVEPNVYLEDEVAMKVALEVSNIVQEIRSLSGTLTYRIGTRNTATVLRVANGETQVLAGLISDEDRRTADKVPGLADMPMLGRLFTSNNDTRTQTEIVLLITPYVVHNLVRPPPSALEIATGTEGSLGAAPLRLQSMAVPGAAISPRVQPSPIQALDVEEEPASSPRPATQALLLAAPSQVQAGRIFGVAVAAPPGISGVQVELVFDSVKLQALGAEGTPGRVQVAVAGTTTVRLRAVEGQSGQAQVGVGYVSAGTTSAGEPIQLGTPAPVTVTITP
jgi:general secretion pathway protein D